MWLLLAGGFVSLSQPWEIVGPEDLSSILDHICFSSKTHLCQYVVAATFCPVSPKKPRFISPLP